MITLYTYSTPNGQKAAIMLEELGLDYRTVKVDLAAGEHLKPDFLALSPVGKIPALVEEDGGAPRRVFGSGAILLHLAEKHGRLMPADPADRAEAYGWLGVGISDLAPAGVSLFLFAVRASEKTPHVIDHFTEELKRCWRAMDARLGETEYLAGAAYSIADISVYPFADAARRSSPKLLENYPNLGRWIGAVGARPAVGRAMNASA
jgi:GSH-dependent disulfide-bond oxidoreductase